MARLPTDTEVPKDFYDREYFLTGEKSAYKPYGPGQWAGWTAEMVAEYLHPVSVLDVGAAMGYVVEELGKQGIPAYGFDISDYAFERKVNARIWRGSASDPAAWRMDVDLVMATELVEHLTSEQARAFLRLAAEHGTRLLVLGVFGVDSHPTDEADWSHIHIVPVQWWLDEATKVGLHLSQPETDQFNQSPHSAEMAWAGRWLYFTKKAETKAARGKD